MTELVLFPGYDKHNLQLGCMYYMYVTEVLCIMKLIGMYSFAPPSGLSFDWCEFIIRLYFNSVRYATNGKLMLKML